MLESQAPTDSRDRLSAFRLDPFGSTRDQALGVTAVLGPDPVATDLDHCLPPLLRAVETVMVVDHPTAEGRTGAADRARSVAADLGLAHRLRVLDYPFELSPPGRAHLDTPPDSVHSLVHFHNWAFSHVRTTYALRWDDSLVLTPGGEALLADFSWQVGRLDVTLRLPRHPLYVESDRVAYLDLARADDVQRGHPVASGYSYVKGFDRAMLRLPEHAGAHTLPAGSCLLLRHLDAGPPAAPAPTAGRSAPSSPDARRERHEADTVRAILSGRWRERPDLHRLEAPAGTHVVDHAATVWSAP